MKRILSFVLLITMLLLMLAGCATDGTTASTDGTSAPLVAKDHIIMTYLTQGTTPPDLEKVVAEVNKISIPAIGVEVEFKAVPITDTFTGQYSLWIGTGEQMDLMMVAFQDISTYIKSNQLEPLKDLIAANAPYINKAATEEKLPIYDGASFNGENYGVSLVLATYGTGGQYLIKHDVLAAAGLTPKAGIYTLDDLTTVFAAIKAKNPEMYPCGVVGKSSTKVISTYLYMGGVYDVLGASMASGVLMGTHSKTVVNLFETPEYYDYLTHMRAWYEAGYIMPDAATTDATAVSLMQSGVFCGYPMVSQPIQLTSAEKTYKTTIDALQTSEVYYGSISSTGSTYWTVPITSKNPEAAIKFLNLTYENHALSNLILNGIEGTHWVKTDKPKVIAFPEGVDAKTSGYYNSLGLYGDRRFEDTFSASLSDEVQAAYTAQAVANKTQATGYSYDSTAFANELIAVQALISQYLPTLETGSASDLKGTYDEFIAKLKNAGIDKIIADNQVQFDAWQAANK